MPRLSETQIQYAEKGCVRTKSARANNVHKPCSLRVLSPLSDENQRLQHAQSLAKRLALLGQGNVLPHRGPHAEKLTNLITCTAKVSGRHKTTKATHGILALFDASMILFQVVVQIHVRSMLHVISHRFVYGTGRGAMTVCRDLFWNMAHNRESLLKKRFCCVHIALLTQP